MPFNLASYCQYHYRQLNALVLAGLLCVLVALVLLGLHYWYWQPQIITAQDKLKHIKHRIALEQMNPPEAPKTEALQLAPKTELYEILEFIQKSADEHALDYSNVQYTAKEVSDLAVLRYEVSYPFKGSYLNLKKFLHQLLSTYQNTLVLSNLELLRDNPQQPMLNGKLQLWVYLNDD